MLMDKLFEHLDKEVTQWVGNSLHRNEILSCEEVELRRSSIGEGIALMPR